MDINKTVYLRINSYPWMRERLRLAANKGPMEVDAVLKQYQDSTTFKGLDLSLMDVERFTDMLREVV